MTEKVRQLSSIQLSVLTEFSNLWYTVHGNINDGQVTLSTEYVSTPTNNEEVMVADLHLLRRPPVICNTTNSSSFGTESPRLKTSLPKNTNISRAELVEDCSDIYSETAEYYSDYSIIAADAHQSVTIARQPSNIYMNPSYGTSAFVNSLQFSSDPNVH